MAVKKGNRTSEDYNNAPVIPGNKKVWFLNGDLVGFIIITNQMALCLFIILTKIELKVV